MELDRRTVVMGIAGLPLAAVLADPLLARAVAQTLETVTIRTAGGQSVGAALALPATTPAPAVLLIHEWWGLNDQIKSVAAELARQGFVALAIDLYHGKVAVNRNDASTYARGVDAGQAIDTLVSWIAWLRKNDRTTGRVATIGWCFGGGWSLNASIATPVDATVIYYGRVTKTAAQLKRLKGPVLGHFGTLDRYINAEMVGGFEEEMRKAGKAASLTVHWYTANHAFANPTGARYDAEDAKLAWQRTLKFLKANL